MFERAGQRALPEDLIDADAVVGAYYAQAPDPTNPDQRVAFGTSGHRGSSVNGAFNESHIIAITQAIVEYRASVGIDGPLFIGKDTHVLSDPAQLTALEVLAASGVTVMMDSRNGYTPTPALSHAILTHNHTGDGTFRAKRSGLADGIIITPSHNPPADGGFKYNPPSGGPADTDATEWIASRANHYLETGVNQIERSTDPYSAANLHRYDFLTAYVDDLPSIINLDVIREAGVRIGADPLGGASVEYWAEIGERHRLNLTVVNDAVDPTFSFMTLDWDGQIRMDCSSPYAMASLVEIMAGADSPYDIATGNDADADRHGIVTRDGGLMNPNHYLAVAIDYLYSHRPEWPADAAIGKTLVSSGLIDRVGAGLGRQVTEVPVGFKWFVPGLLTGELAFGGEESAGASFLRKNGRVWTTDKDGIILGLLASEILAVTGESPTVRHQKLVNRYGQSWYSRLDAPATRAQKAALSGLAPEDVSAVELAGEPITAKLTRAPGNDEAIGGLKVASDNAWFAARPSGTEDVYKIYAESFVSAEHLEQVNAEAREVVDGAAGE